MAYSLKNGKETLTFEVPPQWDVISVAEPQKMEAIPISQIPEVVRRRSTKSHWLFWNPNQN